MATSTDDLEVYCFGEFELDGRNEQLKGNGRPIKLAPQPFRLLLLLVRRAGELVAREEIERHLWDPNITVDFRQGINSSILQLREALGDNAHAPRFIGTEPRRGYRFVFPVARVSSKRLAPLPVQPFVPGRASKLQRGLALVAAALATILLAGAFLTKHTPSQQAVPAPGRVMVAVLPFQDLSVTPAPASFAAGLTDEVIALLGRPHPERVGVISRTTVASYQQNHKGIREIGRELGVAYIVEGSVRRQGNRVRISAQLVRAGDQAYIWCQSYDRELTDSLEAQEDVGRLIAETAGMFLENLSEPASLAKLE